MATDDSLPPPPPCSEGRAGRRGGEGGIKLGEKPVDAGQRGEGGI